MMVTQKHIGFTTDLEKELYLVLTTIESRLERWLRSGIEAGVKGRDRDFDELVEQARVVIAHVQGRER